MKKHYPFVIVLSLLMSLMGLLTPHAAFAGHAKLSSNPPPNTKQPTDDAEEYLRQAVVAINENDIQSAIKLLTQPLPSAQNIAMRWPIALGCIYSPMQ